MTEFRAPRSEHEDICEFAPIRCPMPGCNQAGVKNLLPGHLLAKHKISSVLDVSLEDNYVGGNYRSGYPLWHSVTFDLDSSTTSVLLSHTPSKEFYLLHQENTALGDRLQVTSLAKPPAKSCKRMYEIDVDVKKEQSKQTYCYKSESTSNTDQHGGLLIPKMPDGVPSGKKHCKISMRK